MAFTLAPTAEQLDSLLLLVVLGLFSVHLLQAGHGNVGDAHALQVEVPLDQLVEERFELCGPAQGGVHAVSHGAPSQAGLLRTDGR